MGRLKGEELTFAAGGMTYKGIAKGNTITGSVTTPKGEIPWTATQTLSQRSGRQASIAPATATSFSIVTV